MVKKTQLIISIIFNGGNFPFLIYYLYDSIIHPIDFLHVTRWSYFLNSIYTTICLICDIIIYASEKEGENFELDMNYNLIIDKDNNKNKKDLLNEIKILDNWNKNKYGNVCNSLGYFVSFGFWSLFFLGNSTMQISKSIKSVFNCIYHHCIIQIIVILNIFCSERKKHNFSLFYFGIIFGIYLLYVFIICIEKYFYNKNAYFFMENKSKLFLFFCFVFSSLFLFLSYLFNIFIIDIIGKINKNKFNEDNEEEKDAEKNLIKS